MNLRSGITFLASVLPPLFVGCVMSEERHADDNTPRLPDVDNDASTAAVNEGSSPGALTRLRVHYPAGTHSVSVRGSAGPLSWSSGKVMSVHGEPDTFEYELTLPESVTSVEWKPLLDDATWSRGPNYSVRAGETVDVYPHFSVVKGEVSQLIAPFHSSILQNDRAIWAYLPPSYIENSYAKFPVVYMHDGEKLFDIQPALGPKGWQVDRTLDAAAEDGTISQLIVVGISNSGNEREYEYTPTSDPAEGRSGGGDKYVQMIVNELKPRIDAQLRTLPGRASTAIVGSSYGGLISAHAGVKHASTFGLVGALSPSTWWDDEMLTAEVGGIAQPRPDRVYVDCGGPDDGEPETEQLAAAYRKVGYVEGTDLHYRVQVGDHNEASWAQRLPGALQFLFGSRKP